MNANANWHQRFASYYADVLRTSAQTSSRSLTALDRLFSKQVASDLGVLGMSLEECVERDTIVVDVRTAHIDELLIESDDVEVDEVLGEGEEFTPQVEADRRLLEVRSARKIHRTQNQDPYNRETNLGGVVLSLRSSRGRLSGPLLYWVVDLTFDPVLKRISVTKRTDVPEINTTLLEPFLAEGQDIGEIVNAVRPLLLDRGPAQSFLRQLLSVVSGFLEELEHLSLDSAVDQPLREWLRRSDGEIASRAVLINTAKTNAVILNDLRQIANMSAALASGPLRQLTAPDDADRDPLPPDLPLPFSSNPEPLLFPFLSNPAQRSIALMADRANILTVQGPPGTGKSHTIANLVCHLAATGKSVLVTSHQGKAVEVVTELLRPMRDFALSLASGDRKSSQNLQNRLQALLEDTTLRSNTIADEVKRGTEAMAKLDRELRILAHRFQELRRMEHEGWTGFRRFEELRNWNYIVPEDSPQTGDLHLIEQHLPRWFDLRKGIVADWEDLMALFAPEGQTTPGTVEARIRGSLEWLLNTGRSFQRAPVGPVVQSTKQMCESAANGSSGARLLVADLLHWIEEEAWPLVDEVEKSAAAAEGILLADWARSGRAAGDELLAGFEAGTDRLLSRFETHRARPNISIRVGDDLQAQHLRSVLRVLQNAQSSWLRWYVAPAARRAKRDLEVVVLRSIKRADFDDWARALEGALALFQAERETEQLASEIVSYLNDTGVALSPKPHDRSAAGWMRLLRTLRSSNAVMRLSARAPVTFWEPLASSVSSEDPVRFSRSALAEVSAVLRAVTGVLERDELIQSISRESPLSADWRTRLEPLLGDLQAGRISDEGGVLLDRIEELVNAAGAFGQIRDLERGELGSIPLTLRQLEAELKPEVAAPEWIDSHIADALQAHRLYALINGSLAADPDDVASVSNALRLGQSRRRELISSILDRRVRLRQARALENGGTAAEIRRVRKLLGMSRRLGGSLVALRDQIDYQAVLAACPAWLGTIDDACRLFPAKPELFDCIIVDEASQCAQPALLPLALRCRRLIVVGDSKQLRPSFGRFLRKNDLDALRAKHGLSEHRAGIFAEGSDSLLDFAEFRSNQSGFLDEHFRCDPAIIAWSNDRFYNNRLKILTHRRSNAFRPPLLLRQIAEADDDTEKKQNREEAEAVVRELRRLTAEPSNVRVTMGVISPFRQQSDLIQGLIEREFERDPQVIERHRLLASTADGFQGDERDIILYSFRIGPSSNPNSLGVLEREEERFNVAFSRARLLAISFISSSMDRFPSKDGKSGVVRGWLDHTLSAQQVRASGEDEARPDIFDSEFERAVCGRLRDRGLKVVTQEPCGPFRIDLVVKDTEGRVLAVECDGSWKQDEFGHLRPEDYQRQDLIERAGWVVHRISGRRYLIDPVREIDRTVEVLGRQDTETDRAILQGEEDVPSSEVARDITNVQAAPDERPVSDVEDAGSVEADREAGAVAAAPHAAADTSPTSVLGRPIEKIRPLLRQLIRWTILGSRVQGSMFDRLIIIDDKLAEHVDLDDGDIAALEFIHRIAGQHGFVPEKDLDSAT